MSNPDALGPETSVTIKPHGGDTAPWTTVRGTPEECKRQLIEAFGLPEPTESNVPLIVVVMQAHTYARQLYVLDEYLGATVDVKASYGKSDGQKHAERRKTEEAKPTEEQATPEGEILRQIKAATSNDEINVLWKKFRTGPPSNATKGWPTQEHLDAVKARVAEIKAGA